MRLGVFNIKKVVDKLTALPIEIAMTHAHWDYIGGHQLFGRFDLQGLP